MTAWFLIAFAATCLAIHFATAWLLALRPLWPPRANGWLGTPPVSLLRPIKGADPADIETLGETVRARVKEHSGIELEWEIKRIGVA